MKKTWSATRPTPRTVEPRSARVEPTRAGLLLAFSPRVSGSTPPPPPIYVFRAVCLGLFSSFCISGRAADTPVPAPLRVLVAGLAHGHAGGFLRQAEPAVVRLVGVSEPDDTV